MYQDGRAVLQDLVMAYVWLNAAVANGRRSAEGDRNIARARLNDSERKLGRKLTKLCLKQPASCPKYSK